MPGEAPSRYDLVPVLSESAGDQEGRGLRGLTGEGFWSRVLLFVNGCAWVPFIKDSEEAAQSHVVPGEVSS